jgi:biotin synthase
MQSELRHDWRADEIRAIHDKPLLDLVFDAASVHRAHHDPAKVQVCKLINIKTGGCPEDCGYCSQSAHWQTGVEAQALMDKGVVVDIARKAIANGVSRVCMGAAWRDVRDGVQFDRVLEIVREVSSMGVEVCCTLGMLTESQAKRLEEAGLYAYNHNLDTSRAHYDEIVTTRTYDDRLRTIGAVRKTRVTVCTGGILGIGESIDDRIALLQTLAALDPHPESVPINILAKAAGTPMEHQPDVPFTETLRMIATARILMPRSVVRLSAGRVKLSTAEQALCFLAGANSIFSSDTRQMLTATAPSPDYDDDKAMLDLLGLQARRPTSTPTHA